MNGRKAKVYIAVLNGHTRSCGEELTITERGKMKMLEFGDNAAHFQMVPAEIIHSVALVCSHEK